MTLYSFGDLAFKASKACRDAIYHLEQQRDIESASLALSAARLWSYRANYALKHGNELRDSDFETADAWAYDEQNKAFLETKDRMSAERHGECVSEKSKSPSGECRETLYESALREILIACGSYGDGGNLDKFTRLKCLSVLETNLSR